MLLEVKVGIRLICIIKKEEYLEDGELLDATRKPVSLYKFCGGKSPRGSIKQKIVRRNTCKR